MSTSSSRLYNHFHRPKEDLSSDRERQMHYILDEGISELKKSSDTNKSGYSNQTSSDHSFTTRNQAQGSRSNSKEYKRQQIYEKYHQKQPSNTKNEQSSSLRMFLEELKNENYNYDVPSNRYERQRSPSNPTSMASSGNIEMIKMQEESFSKIHHDIASLQNKIKGLESKLGTQGKANFRALQERKLNQESFEDRPKKYQSSRGEQPTRAQNLPIKQVSIYNQQQPKQHFIDEKAPLLIKDNLHTFNKSSDQEDFGSPISHEDSEDAQSYQTFPLRLKKQYLQQQLDLEKQRENLNQRYSHQKHQQQIVEDRYEHINDSQERKKVVHQVQSQRQESVIEYENQIRSLTETDHESVRPRSNSSSKLNDSTISVSEKMKRKIKEKMTKFKDRQRQRSQSLKKSPAGSLKRSNTQDQLKKETASKVQRHVRFSESKRSSRSRERKNSQISFSSTTDQAELKKRNALLKAEIEKLHKKLEAKEDYSEKWRNLKLKYKELQDDYKKQDLKRREQKEVIEEQKKMIAKLKKKVKSQKEKLKKLQTEPSPARSEYTTKLKTNKSYKSFIKMEDKENARQKSAKKIHPSDIANARVKSKSQRVKAKL